MSCDSEVVATEMRPAACEAEEECGGCVKATEDEERRDWIMGSSSW